MASDNDWPVVVGNLKKSWTKWAKMLRISGREGAKTWLSRTFFKAVVQAVLLFGSETWVMTPHMGRAMGLF